MSLSPVSRTADNPAHTDSQSFKRPGIQNKLMARLHRGQIPVERQLDLHGLTVREARNALEHFLTECLRQNIRCIRIVHGKGLGSPGRKPVIKKELYHWLRRHPDLLAFCPAPHHDGGSGATYVLLKNTG